MKVPNELDENLQEYATDRQWEKIVAYHEHGSLRRAGEAVGVNKNGIDRAYKAVLRRAAKSGYSPQHDMIHTVPDGFMTKGVSTYYGQDGLPKGQWVKSQVDRDRQAEIIQEWIKGLSDEIPRASKVPQTKLSNSDFMSVYPVGDHHFGMMAWGEETGGEDYDIKIAEDILYAAMDNLVERAEHSEKSAILLMGDFLHYDGMAPVTPTNKHLLDSDSRFPKMVRVAIRSIRYLVNAALRKHSHVKLIIEIGNHDLASSVWLMELFTALYEFEPRVDVDNSPKNIHAFEFGNNLIVTHHGHGVKMEKLPLVIANDYRESWGRCKNVYAHMGHVHHDAAKDLGGVRVESHGVLAPNDAHAASHGYRSASNMKVINYHYEHGEYSRYFFNPGMM